MAAVVGLAALVSGGNAAAGRYTARQEGSMSDDTVIIHIDGAARGNPGPAAFAFYLTRPGQPPEEVNGRLGRTTNNVAEYTALVRALTRARELNAGDVLIRSDSELLVKQMNGEYRVKNEQLKELYDEANALRRQLPAVRIVHVRREQNQEADRLCNEALDGAPAPAPVAPAVKEARPKVAPRSSGDTWEEVRCAVLDVLLAAATADTTVEQVSRAVVKQFQQRGFRPPEKG
jgi:ribonuclease HI